VKASVLVANGIIELQERAYPQLEDDEYIVKIIAVGICNSDIYRAYSGQAYHYPLVMGHEISGVIAEKGCNTNKYSIGQKVVVFPLIPCNSCDYCKKREWVHCEHYDYYGSRRDGGYQEYLAVKEWNILPIGSDIDPILACLCEPVAVSIHAVDIVPRTKSNETALVIGAGLIGLVISARLREKGCNVTITDRNDFKLNIAKEIGVTPISPDELTSHIHSFPLIVEASGAPVMFQNSIKWISPFGNVIWVGNIQGNLNLNQQEVSNVLRKEITIKGVWNSNYQQGINDDWYKAQKVIKKSIWLYNILEILKIEDVSSKINNLYQSKTNRFSNNTLKTIVKF